MAEAPDFRELMLRVRAGDEAAATELVRLYEPFIRRAARVRLGDVRERRLLDASDICQSVLASFFVRAALGQYELDKPQQLVRLLEAMARNKIVDQVRKRVAAGPSVEPLPDDVEGATPYDTGSTPSQQVARQDLLQEFRKRLSAEERQLAEQRTQGREWTEIATALGGSPEAFRKKLARGFDRVARELGLEV
jgi:RNA polymerase sigma factor (sigma-70 family)